MGADTFCDDGMTEETARDMLLHLSHARTKHPWSADMTDAEKYRIAEHELQEMGVAMLKSDVRGMRKEALDCAAVLIRIVEGE